EVYQNNNTMEKQDIQILASTLKTLQTQVSPENFDKILTKLTKFKK
ncbi:unnamed protein product, partial [marine sediment metagenome]